MDAARVNVSPPSMVPARSAPYCMVTQPVSSSRKSTSQVSPDEATVERCTHSTSQMSPMPSPSASPWPGLAMSAQLSSPSAMPSPSVSTASPW